MSLFSHVAYIQRKFKNVYLKILLNLQENTRTGVSFLIETQASSL